MTDISGDQRTLRKDEIEAHHVDVQEAEQIFTDLSRALSRRSAGEPEEAYEYKPSSGGHEDDIEKGEKHRDEPFDLRDYLQSTNDANQSAGIKHKHVGVTWENLQVEVAGSEDEKVHTRRLILLHS